MPLGKNKVERLALKLRNRCFKELMEGSRSSHSPFVLSSVSKSYGDYEGSYEFTVVQTTGSYPHDRVWKCDIFVTPELDVVFVPREGDVPKYLLDCALRGQ
jgi:hypothetical protein